MAFEAFVTAEREGWHDRAAGYEDHTGLATLQIIPAMLDALAIQPGQRLLDTACGPGHVAGAAAALNVDAEGVDYALGMIDTARERFPQLAFAVADAESLPHPSDSFDMVASNMGLFHMGDPARAMREAARVLRPGGRFAFSQWTSPDDSPLYSLLFGILSEIADLTRAHAAPDAFSLSDPEYAKSVMKEVGFTDVTVRRLDTQLIATGPSFFDFFMRFGVRVPLIVAAQDADVQHRLRDRINEAMTPYRTAEGFRISMPSLLYTGMKP